MTSISRQTSWQLLTEAGICWQATTTGKASTDLQFLTKTHRVLDLDDNRPPEARVVCVDEVGPRNLQPRPGRA